MRATQVRLAATVLTAALQVAALSACSSAPNITAPDLETRVVVDNPELRAFKQGLKIADCATLVGETDDPNDLPAVTLPCLGGGTDVNLSQIQGPAVISLWASWCTSCSEEMPLFQRLAEDARGQLKVVGVDYQDTQPGAALVLAEMTGVRYPLLADPGGNLGDTLSIRGLPALIFLDRSGTSTFRPVVVSNYADLLDLTRRYAGVAVERG